MADAAQVLKLIRSRRYSPMTAAEMAAHLGVAHNRREEFFQTIEELKLAGEIVEVKNRRLADPERVDLVVGRLHCNPRGFGFIVPVRERDGQDLYIAGENMSSALHGDLVVARAPGMRRRKEKVRRPARRLRGYEPEVKVVAVLQRARMEIVGTLRREGHVHFVIPDDPRLFRDVVVAPDDLNGAKPDDKVVVRITVWPSRHTVPAGEVVEVLGQRGRLEVERLSVVREFGLRDAFPPAVLEAAARLPDRVREEDLAGRRDMTGELTFTCDPEDARDFDDAVSLRRLERGEWELGVHIADVTHYVRPEDPIDREARARGTSVYLPGQVLPMLPEKLSNNLCSLLPGHRRLTKTVLMRFDSTGRLVHSEVFASFIRSARRFNYAEVQRVIEGGSLQGDEEHLARTIRDMHELAELLRGRRRESGMIELALPEAHILTDSKGRTVGVELRRNDESHRLIEQFMLAANEAVAKYLIRHHLPYICRAHDQPDPKAIEEFRQVAQALGHPLPPPGTRQQIQRFLARLEGRSEAPVLNYLLLRSMKMAEYRAEEDPHYAIAATHYLHFTSPIRRYPDLLAHRILQEHWSGRLNDPQRVQEWKERLPAWAAHSSEMERNAQEAERAITTRRLLEFVAQQKRPLPALITAVENYGLRVQLCDYLIDGVVRMSVLTDGFYRVDRDRGALVGPRRKEYRIGQTMHVRVLRYNEFKHQIELEPVSGPKKQ